MQVAHRLAPLGQLFITFAQTAIASQASKGSFDSPTPRQQRERAPKKPSFSQKLGF